MKIIIRDYESGKHKPEYIGAVIDDLSKDATLDATFGDSDVLLYDGGGASGWVYHAHKNKSSITIYCQ